MRPRIRTAAIAALIVSAPVVSGAPKEIRKPPVGDTLSVETMRGGSTKVTLKAYEGRGNPLAYQIDRQPKHGTLSDFRQADANRQGFASVIYTHRNDEQSYEDEFTFRARAVGGGVSSPIKVRIRIIDDPPRLAAPTRVDFSAFAGESDLRIIGLTNAGGGVLEGTFRPEEPFHIDGEGKFRLGRGQSTELAVRFSPRSTAAVPTQKLVPTPADPAGIIVLAAETKEPFAAEAGPVEVQNDGAREGTITVTNLCSFPLALSTELHPEGSAEMDSNLQVPAGGKGRLSVRIGADKKGGPLDLSVRIGDEFYSRDLTIPVPAVPPRLELLTAELDFRGQDEAPLVVRNTGGVAGRFKLELPAGLVTRERAANFAVPPGEDTLVNLRREKEIAGEDPEAVIVNLGASGKIPVHVVTAAKTPTPAPTQDSITNSPPTPTVRPEPDWIWTLNKDVKLQASGSDYVVVEWLASKGGSTNAHIATVDAQGIASAYSPQAADRSLLQWIADWWSGLVSRIRGALGGIRGTFDKRLEMSGEEEEPEPTPKPRENIWQSVEVGRDVWENAQISWRVIAQREDDEPKAVSSDFTINGEAGILEAVDEPAPDATREPQPADTATNPMPGVGPVVAMPAQAIKPMAWEPARDGARITYQMPLDEGVRNYRFERMRRFLGTDPATGYARITYEGEPMLQGSAEILERKAVSREGAEYDEVTVRFSGLDSGTEVYWRAVPIAGESGDRLPSEILHFWTLPPPRIPWTSIALFACSGTLLAVMWLRWRSRQPPH